MEALKKIQICSLCEKCSVKAQYESQIIALKKRYEEEIAFLKLTNTIGEASLNSILMLPIEKLRLTTRIKNCLKHAGKISVSDLVKMTDQDFLQMRHFGKKSLEEVKACLETLKMLKEE